MSKIVLFEYFLKKLVDWYCKYYHISIKEFNNHSYNNLSKLKVIKLHFFACSTSKEALNIFDDFHAMPYGHVESEVYNKLDRLQFCSISNSKLVIEQLEEFENLTCLNHSIIDIAVEELRDINFQLIALEPFELVELSHKWFSWRYNFQKARNEGAYSKPIHSDLILREEKFYSLV